MQNNEANFALILSILQMRAQGAWAEGGEVGGHCFMLEGNGLNMSASQAVWVVEKELPVE